MIECSLSDLGNESDVEQKLLYPLMSHDFGFEPGEIFTESQITPTDID